MHSARPSGVKGTVGRVLRVFMGNVSLKGGCTREDGGERLGIPGRSNAAGRPGGWAAAAFDSVAGPGVIQ